MKQQHQNNGDESLSSLPGPGEVDSVSVATTFVVHQGRILRLRSVVEKTGLSRSSIYAAMKAGTFPKSIQISARSIGWLDLEVSAWLKSRVEISRE